MEAYRLLYRSRVGMEHAREILAGGEPLMPELQVLFDFIQDSQVGWNGAAVIGERQHEQAEVGSCRRWPSRHEFTRSWQM